jgi:hypothetical protein
MVISGSDQGERSCVRRRPLLFPRVAALCVVAGVCVWRRYVWWLECVCGGAVCDGWSVWWLECVCVVALRDLPRTYQHCTIEYLTWKWVMVGVASSVTSNTRERCCCVMAPPVGSTGSAQGVWGGVPWGCMGWGPTGVYG